MLRRCNGHLRQLHIFDFAKVESRSVRSKIIGGYWKTQSDRIFVHTPFRDDSSQRRNLDDQKEYCRALAGWLADGMNRLRAFLLERNLSKIDPASLASVEKPAPHAGQKCPRC